MASEAEKTRFVHEAQAAAALNHPNICTIYEIDEAEGQAFIAMEFVEGQSLKDKIASGPAIPLRSVEGKAGQVASVIDFAFQIAEGLQAAHEKGITHRDIKPANIMVSTKGQVKIMDFGLAKLPDRTKLTKSGSTLGTVAYMSPEQVQGMEVDHRTDIWSFGVVLYELLTGELPFKGDYEQVVMYAIVNMKAQPLTALRPEVPAELERVVMKAMAKKLDERYQTTDALLPELSMLRETLKSKLSTKPGRRDYARISGRRLTTGAAMLVAFLIMASYLLVRLANKKPPAPQLVNPLQITFTAGMEDWPSWSPESGRLAYASNQDGNWDIWVTQLNAGQPLNRTANYDGRDWFPSWSPDGSLIAFWSEREDGGYFVMSPLAGSPRKITKTGLLSATTPQWSTDGSLLACVVEDTAGLLIRIVSLQSGNVQSISLPAKKTSVDDLSWSPDGHFFAYVEAAASVAQVTQLWILRVADGAVIPITEGRTEVWSPSWAGDGQTLYFISNRGGSMDLWQQRLRDDGTPNGDPQPITTGIGMRRAAFSRDGAKLVYSKGRRVANLWCVPILKDRPANWAEATQLTRDHAYIEFVDVSPDGKSLLLNSDRSGNPDLWAMPATGGEMQQITSDPTPDWNPFWSPNGKEILFYAYRSGNRDIWVQPVDGGPARQVTKHQASDLYADWSPDGKEICFASLRSGNYDLWIVPSEGGEERQLTAHPANDYQPEWSPEGAWIVFVSDRSGEASLWRIPANASDEGERAEPLTQASAKYSRWSPDGQWVYFLDNQSNNIWAVSSNGNHERPVTNFTGQLGELSHQALATDGRQLFFTWIEDIGDLWVMKVEPKK
jgi:Tol biopolymer transport system component